MATKSIMAGRLAGALARSERAGNTIAGRLGVAVPEAAKSRDPEMLRVLQAEREAELLEAIEQATRELPAAPKPLAEAMQTEPLRAEPPAKAAAKPKSTRSK